MKRKLLSPVSGTFRHYLVAIGDLVAAETEVAMIESMKMEIPVLAEFSGRVAALPAQPDELIEEGALLIEFAG